MELGHMGSTPFWGHVYLVKQLPRFDVVTMAAGRGGEAMKRIKTATGARLRISGRGSGFVEAVPGADDLAVAPVPLMVCLAADILKSFEEASTLLDKHLQVAVNGAWPGFCKDRRDVQPLVPGQSLFFFGQWSTRVGHLVYGFLYRQPANFFDWEFPPRPLPDREPAEVEQEENQVVDEEEMHREMRAWFAGAG